MAAVDKPINIIHYEDKTEYALSFKTRAQSQRIIVKTVDNVEDLLQSIREKPRKYQYVVLDARAFRFEGQADGTESEIYLMKIFIDLEKIRNEHNVLLPCCINTGFADLKLKLANTVDCPIYDKGDEEKLFADIWASYNGSSTAKLLRSFPEIFEWANERFAEADLAILASLYSEDKYKSCLIADRVSNLADLRRTMEHLIDIIYSEYLGSVPGVVTSSGTRMREITDHLNQNGDVPVHVYSIITSIRKTASTYGSHTPATPQEAEEYPSGDFISGLSLGLKDVFRWARTKLN